MRKKINLNSIDRKIPKVSFELFKYWTKELSINEKIIIRSEQLLIDNLKEAISNALISLNKTKKLEKKTENWKIGFVIGFVDGNLGKHWHHEYIVKTKKIYKTFIGLRSIETYLKFKEIDCNKVDELYESLLKNDSNILNHNETVKQIDLYKDDLTINNSIAEGKVLTILNNLIIKHIKKISKMKNPVTLPIQQYFTTDEIHNLIVENKI